jgi:hypothetical protein
MTTQVTEVIYSACHLLSAWWLLVLYCDVSQKMELLTATVYLTTHLQFSEYASFPCRKA